MSHDRCFSYRLGGSVELQGHSGMWNPDVRPEHINYLELRVGNLTFKFSIPILRHLQVLVNSC